MKSSKDTGQLTLFDEKSTPISQTKPSQEVPKREAKIVSLLDYKDKKAEELYKSYAAKLLNLI